MPTLETATSVLAPPPRPREFDPRSATVFRDLAEPFGAVLDENALAAGPGVSHRDLVEALVDDEVRDRTPELIVLANALPDAEPHTVVAPHLNLLLGGSATSFGISQQGLAAPFTALRIVDRFQRSGRVGSAAIAVLEQTTLPIRHPLAQQHELVDSGVLLVFGTGDGPVLSGVESVAQPPARRLRELARQDTDGTLLVLGPRVDTAGLGDDVRYHRGESRTHATGVWLELARHWQEWVRAHRAVVVCDTDPGSGRSHLAVLRPPSAA